MHFILFSGSQVGLPQKQSWGKKMSGSSLFRRRWPQEALVGVEEWGREREEVWMEPQQCWRYFWVLDCCLNLAWKPGTFWLSRESKQHCSLSYPFPLFLGQKIREMHIRTPCISLQIWEYWWESSGFCWWASAVSEGGSEVRAQFSCVSSFPALFFCLECAQYIKLCFLLLSIIQKS